MFKENKKARYSTLCIEKHLQLHLFFFFSGKTNKNSMGMYVWGKIWEQQEFPLPIYTVCFSEVFEFSYDVFVFH